MTDLDYILRGLNITALIGMIILFIRFYKIDQARARKTNAESGKIEADSQGALVASAETLIRIITMEWDKTKHDLKEVQQNNLALQQMIATERMECDEKIDALERHHSEKMAEMERHFTAEINKLKNKRI